MKIMRVYHLAMSGAPLYFKFNELSGVFDLHLHVLCEVSFLLLLFCVFVVFFVRLLWRGGGGGEEEEKERTVFVNVQDSISPRYSPTRSRQAKRSEALIILHFPSLAHGALNSSGNRRPRYTPSPLFPLPPPPIHTHTLHHHHHSHLFAVSYLFTRADNPLVLSLS